MDINQGIMTYWEVYLDDVKKSLGRYNQKYYSESKIGEIVKHRLFSFRGVL